MELNEKVVAITGAASGIGRAMALRFAQERAHITAARLLVPGWIERGEGYFLSTASAAGLLSVIGSAPHAVTKHAAVAFAEWLAITFRDRGVRVSCVCPMGVRTKLLEEGLQ